MSFLRNIIENLTFQRVHTMESVILTTEKWYGLEQSNHCQLKLTELLLQLIGYRSKCSSKNVRAMTTDTKSKAQTA
jgi:hypothetical protein